MVVDFKKGHNNSRHIDELKLDESEARDFVVLFLKPEIERHINAIKMCQKRIVEFYPSSLVARIAYESSIHGHLEDITATQKTINDIKQKWGWINGEGK